MFVGTSVTILIFGVIINQLIVRCYHLPNIEIAATVDAQKTYNGSGVPVDTTVSMMVGNAKYKGAEPNVKMKNVLRRPIISDTAAQPNRPPVERRRRRQRSRRRRFVRSLARIYMGRRHNKCDGVKAKN